MAPDRFLKNEECKLSIIVVSKNNIDDLYVTCTSIAKQRSVPMGDRPESHVEVIIVANYESEDDTAAVQAFASELNAVLLLNQDSGLYNAMNIGLLNAGGGFIYFLNAGDRFYDSDSLSAILGSLNSRVVHRYRVVQVFQDLRFLRPGLKGKKYFSHQGLIVPLSNTPMLFDESIPVAADSDWIQRQVREYGAKDYRRVVCEFSLGGISNYPSLSNIRSFSAKKLRWKAIKEGLKLILFHFLGPRAFYIFIAKMRCYDTEA